MNHKSPLEALAEVAPEGDRLSVSLPGPFRRALRVHPRRGKPSGWGELTPTPFHARGRFHSDDLDPGNFLDYHCGTVYPQDGASQVPVQLLDLQTRRDL